MTSLIFVNFVRYINIFEKFNNEIVVRSRKKLDNRLGQHYNLSYAKGSVITIIIFMMSMVSLIINFLIRIDFL